jgi:uncharacterized membrane protein required for colicin V production
MHWLDTSTLFFALGAAAFGFVFGFVKPLIRLGLIALAMATAGFLAPVLIGVVNDNTQAGYPSFPVVGLIFIASLTVYMTVFVLFRRQVWKAAPGLASTLARLHWIDRLFGATAAALLAVVFVGLLVVFCRRMDAADIEYRFQGSRLHREVMTRLEPSLKQLPDGVKKPFRGALAWLKKPGEKPVKPGTHQEPGATTPASKSDEKSKEPPAFVPLNRDDEKAKDLFVPQPPDGEGKR